MTPRPLLLALALLAASLVAADPAYLVKDINVGLAPASAGPDFFRTVGNVVFFNTSDSQANPLELWRTDGTVPGTFRLGPGGDQKVVWNGKVWFFNRLNQPDEIWSTDGTVQGTQTLSLSAVSPNLRGVRLMPGPDFLYFFANNGDNDGARLWRTDGTTLSTVQVSNVKFLPLNFLDQWPPDWVVAGTSLYFSAAVFAGVAQTPAGYELWRVSSAGGLSQITDVNDGFSYFSELRKVGNLVVCKRYANGVYHYWSSDGTAAGTHSIRATQPIASTWRPGIASAAALYFVGNDGAGSKLWRTDGTDAGTAVVLSTVGGASSNFDQSYPIGLFANGTLLLLGPSVGGPGANSYWGAWAYDGTNTTFLTNIPEGNRADEATVAVTHAILASGDEMWRTDGTVAGTYKLGDVHGSTGYHNWRMAALGDAVFFGASDDTHGFELWRTDGTVPGTGFFADLLAPTNNSNPMWLTPVANGVVFAAEGNATWQSSGTRDLWYSDGSEAGTQKIFDAVGWLNWSVRCGDRVYLSRLSGGLWATDGTAAGTTLVRDLAAQYPVCAHNTLFYTTASGESVALWRSDGTAAGTLVVKTLRQGDGPPRLFAWKNEIYFVARPVAAAENEPFSLWKSDGTPAGTAALTNVGASGNASFAANDTSLFIGAQGLWVSDGTSGGTHAIASGYQNTIVGVAGNRVIYQSNPDAYSTIGLCSTDGVAAPTCFLSSPPHGNDLSFHRLNGRLYYNETKLYSTDGFTVADAGLWFDELLTVAAGRLFGKVFSYDSFESNGNILRETDGNSATTILHGSATEAVASRGKLFIAAGELFAYDLPVTTISLSPSTVPAGGGTTVTITGRGLDASAVVRVGGIAVNVTGTTANAITFIAPAMNGGSYPVDVILGGTREMTVDTPLTYTCGTLTASTGTAPEPVLAFTSVTLHGSGGSRCAWFPSDGLDDASSCDPVATIGKSTTYTLLVRAASGFCESANHPAVRVRIRPPVPAGVVATANGSFTAIGVSWGTSSGATSYEVLRASASNPEQVVATVTAQQPRSISDTTVQPGNAYVYRVRALLEDVPSVSSTPDLASTFTFSNDPLLAGLTAIGAAHVNELRQGIDKIRVVAGLAPVTWTDTISIGTITRAIHVSELRGALLEAFTQLGIAPPPMNAPVSGDVIRASDLQLIRSATR